MHERPGNTAEVDPLVALVDVVGVTRQDDPRLCRCQSRLHHQRRLELWRQLLPTLGGAAQDTQAGSPA